MALTQYTLVTDEFIDEVKKYPEIWNLSCETKKDVKQEAWIHISRALVYNYENLTQEEKVDVCKQLKNKWRNLRDVYTRALKEDRNTTCYRKISFIMSVNDNLLHLEPGKIDDGSHAHDGSCPTNAGHPNFVITVSNKAKAKVAAIKALANYGNLILEVKKFPVVWNVQSIKQRETRLVLRQEAWDKISRVLIENYDDFSKTEKEEVRKTFSAKWKNLKDTYIRALKKNPHTAIKHGRKISFLKVLLQKPNDDDDDEIENQSQADEDSQEHYENSNKRPRYSRDVKIEVEETSGNSIRANTATVVQPARKVIKKEEPLNAASPSLASEECLDSQEGEDEDRHFFSSLMSAVKEFDMDQKLRFRSEVLAAITKIRHKPNPLYY